MARSSFAAVTSWSQSGRLPVGLRVPSPVQTTAAATISSSAMTAASLGAGLAPYQSKSNRLARLRAWHQRRQERRRAACRSLARRVRSAARSAATQAASVARERWPRG
ncbi:MAG: hypothetical protein JF886_10220 [Candidatus Dormibacteraeota bacterium]|uniref:Uncharacterized protein n=1 Tax=Candidatus Aeolococcus gillhamiae TaxID=3127015 RepID=A0A934K2V9_9BACT|nr:hypothetical protein [Candidatus Dormibacteraeota bacterium]